VASPLLANIALSALDRQYEADWRDMSRHAGRRQYLQRTGRVTYRHIRYADDLVVLARGTREQAQAQALLEQLTGRVEALGLQLKAEKTAITHIDEGFLFLGQRIVRRPKASKRYVYTFVSNEALASARRKVKALTGRSTTNLELSELIAALNPVLRGWANYFRHAAAKRTFDYLGYYAWWRVGRWLRKKHPRMTWKQIARRYTSEPLTPNDFADLDQLEQHLLAFGRRYEQIAAPFQWKFTRDDLDRVIHRLDRHAAQAA
jgi:RNA-directed DNA polymerase